MRVSRDLILIFALFCTLIVVMLFVLPRLGAWNKPLDVPYSTYSTYDDGARALYLLLDKMGYDVKRIRSEPYTLPKKLKMLFLLEPSRFNSVNADSVNIIDEWVRQGNILIVAGTGVDELDEFFKMYKLKLHTLKNLLMESGSLQTVFQNPPVELIRPFTNYVIDAPSKKVIPLFGSRQGDHTVISFQIGQGRVFALSCPYVFTNEGLSHTDNVKLLHNLLTYLPKNSSAKKLIGATAIVGFDEYHHGFRTVASKSDKRTRPSPIRLLLSTPPGLAFMYACILIFLFSILRGRRFGKPILTDESARRLSSEYVTSMAGLYQKSGKQSAILQHIRTEFRRRLAAKWDLDPNLSTSDFVDALAQRDVPDFSTLKELLTDLDTAQHLSEERLLELAQRVWQKN